MSLSENKIVVYRFRMVDAGREIAPQHMWGTMEAIAALPGCEPIPESARTVHRKLLEQGFFFEQAAGSYIPIDEQGPPGSE